MRELARVVSVPSRPIQRQSSSTNVAAKLACDGAIKFRLEWSIGKAPRQIQELMCWRNYLYGTGLIGAYPDGVGYGNISRRLDKGFIISGSATGGCAVATAEEFTWVTDYDIEKNFVSCLGPVRASSESLTHAAVYEASDAIQAVVHGHHGRIWKSMYGKAVMTDANIPYGTPQLAKEILRLFETTRLESEQFFVMAGHQDGIVSFGSTPEEAAMTMINLL